jgi:hypothetical protein
MNLKQDEIFTAALRAGITCGGQSKIQNRFTAQ